MRCAHFLFCFSCFYFLTKKCEAAGKKYEAGHLADDMPGETLLYTWHTQRIHTIHTAYRQHAQCSECIRIVYTGHTHVHNYTWHTKMQVLSAYILCTHCIHIVYTCYKSINVINLLLVIQCYVLVCTLMQVLFMYHI